MSSKVVFYSFDQSFCKILQKNNFICQICWLDDSLNSDYSETLNNEYIGRIYQMSSWQFFNEFYTILRK